MRADPTVAFFAALESRGQEPLLRKASGTCASISPTASGPSAGSCDREGRYRGVARGPRGGLRRLHRSGALSTTLRAAGRTRWQRSCARELSVEGDISLLVRSSGSFPPRSRRDVREREARRGGSNGRRPGPDPRRQHLRRQRRERRHRGVPDRPDRPLLVRHTLPLQVGADRRRRAARIRSRSTTCSTSRRASSSCRARDRLHRRQALGDPSTRRRERLPRRAHDPQPRREAGRPAVRVEAGCDFADLFEVKDALAKKGRTHASSSPAPAARLSARDVQRETSISASAPARVDKTGLTFKVRIEPHRSWTTDLDVVTRIRAPAERHVRPKYARGASGPGRAWR